MERKYCWKFVVVSQPEIVNGFAPTSKMELRTASLKALCLSSESMHSKTPRTKTVHWSNTTPWPFGDNFPRKCHENIYEQHFVGDASKCPNELLKWTNAQRYHRELYTFISMNIFPSQPTHIHTQTLCRPHTKAIIRNCMHCSAQMNDGPHLTFAPKIFAEWNCISCISSTNANKTNSALTPIWKHPFGHPSLGGNATTMR